MPAAFPIEVGVGTDKGRERSVSGDSCHASVVLDSADNPWKVNALLVVGDSRSAVVGDTTVSKLAVQALVRSFVSLEAGSAGYRRTTDRDLELFLGVVTEYVNDLIYAAGNSPEGTHMGTTLTFAVIRGNRYYVSHVGNSRAYLMRAGRVQQLTRDHSWIAEQVRRKEMSEAEARLSPFRDRLTQAIGMRSSVEPDIVTGTLQESDVLLLCSDGLMQRLTEEDLRRTLTLSPSLQRACAQLVQMAKEREVADDVTVVGARVGLVMTPVTSGTTEAGRPSSLEPSLAERVLNRLSHLIERVQYRPALLTVLIAAALFALAAGMLSGSILPGLRRQPPSKDLTVSPPRTFTKTTALRPRVESILLKVVADEQKRSVRLHAPSARVMLESKGEQDQGEQQGDDVLIAFRYWDATRDRLLQGGGRLIVKQTKGKVSVHTLGDPPAYEKFFKGAPLTLKVSPDGSYLLLYQASSGDVIRLCRFSVK